MKVEDHDKLPKLDLSEAEDIRAQGKAEHVSHLITDGGTYDVEPESFHYYFTKRKDGSHGVPFIQFDVPGWSENKRLAGKRIEIVNISSVVGIAYEVVDE